MAKRSGTSSRHRQEWSLLTNLTQETTAELKKMSNRGSSEAVLVNPDVDITAHIGVCTHLCSSHLSQINIIIARGYKGQRSIFLLFSFPTSDLSLISASEASGNSAQRLSALRGFGAGSRNVPGTLSVSRRDGEL